MHIQANGQRLIYICLSHSNPTCDLYPRLILGDYLPLSLCCCGFTFITTLTFTQLLYLRHLCPLFQFNLPLHPLSFLFKALPSFRHSFCLFVCSSPPSPFTTLCNLCRSQQPKSFIGSCTTLMLPQHSEQHSKWQIRITKRCRSGFNKKDFRGS